MQISISIVVPVYNVEKYLERCLSSIVAQRFKNFECILVEDCSTDSSLSILRNYIESYPDIFKLIQNETNSGLSHSRHNGYMVARGEYIVYLDSDDYLSDIFLESMYKKIISDDYDIVVCNHIEVMNDGVEKIFDRCSRFKVNRYADNFAWGRIIKKSYLDENYRLPIRMFLEDVVLNIKLLSSNPKFGFVPDGLYYYVQRNGSLLNSQKSLSELEFCLLNICNEFKSLNKKLTPEQTIFLLELFSFTYKYIETKSDQYKLYKKFISNIEVLPKFSDMRAYSTKHSNSAWRKLLVLFKTNGLYLLRPRFKRTKVLDN